MAAAAAAVADIEDLLAWRNPHAASAHDWHPSEVPSFHAKLLAWYDTHARSLPWRGPGVSAYATWVSEVMCQQTRVDAVVPHFNQWMAKFPTVTALAEVRVALYSRTEANPLGPPLYFCSGHCHWVCRC
jgi:hypothetical protein